jgi:UDPglucose--hexose-1-phosphate uridylyltransferase
MDRAGVRFGLRAPAAGIEARALDWPMTAIRLTGCDRATLIDLAVDMLDAWRGWSDPERDILAWTDAPHNAITPILRREGGKFRLDLVLRNNRTSDRHPLGIFHPHAPLHHIKKENIGLIEVMGLFVLPGRLKTELDAVRRYVTGEWPLSQAPEAASPLAQHYEWIRGVATRAGGPLPDAEAESNIR